MKNQTATLREDIGSEAIVVAEERPQGKSHITNSVVWILQ